MVLEFVFYELSEKTEAYIKNELFSTQKAIETFFNESSESLKESDKDLIIGELESSEVELFVIRNSLSRRLNGTRKRIDNSHSELEDATLEFERTKITEKLSEREERFKELFTDYDRVYNYLNSLIINRLKDKIDHVLGKKPNIIKEKYRQRHDCHSNTSGFDFKIVERNKIVLTNHYVMGGD